MKLMLVRHLWGVELPTEVALPRFKKRGYDAIESPLPPDMPAFRRLLDASELEYVAMIFTAGRSMAELLESFKVQAKAAVAGGARQITAHSGVDTWSLAEMLQFYREIEKIEADLPLKIGHETHRGRAFFNPWITRDVLQQCPAIKLTCDFSHWVCVAERLNWDDAEVSILKLCAERTIHTHTRIGHEQGPQVNDPAAPEHAYRVEAHLKWWLALWASQKTRGETVCTATPEFGPPGYLQTLPFTNVPVADLEKVCDGVADRVKEAFNSHVV